ncbi:MAG: hypothetical protein ACOCSD_04325 [Halolamina sp.]
MSSSPAASRRLSLDAPVPRAAGVELVAVVADSRVENDRLLTLTRVPVLVTLALVVAVLAAAADSTGGALVLATRAAVIGVAAVVYAATESLVTPTLVYPTFAVLSSVLYVATVAGAFGG